MERDQGRYAGIRSLLVLQIIFRNVLSHYFNAVMLRRQVSVVFLCYENLFPMIHSPYVNSHGQFLCQHDNLI